MLISTSSIIIMDIYIVQDHRGNKCAIAAVSSPLIGEENIRPIGSLPSRPIWEQFAEFLETHWQITVDRHTYSVMQPESIDVLIFKTRQVLCIVFSALLLLVRWQEVCLACKKRSPMPFSVSYIDASYFLGKWYKLMRCGWNCSYGEAVVEVRSEMVLAAGKLSVATHHCQLSVDCQKSHHTDGCWAEDCHIERSGCCLLSSGIIFVQSDICEETYNFDYSFQWALTVL